MAPLISIHDLKPGMVLAEPVLTRWGQILLNKGCRLRPNHLTLLRTWGIAKVRVQEEKEDSVATVDEAALGEARNKVQRRLKWKPKTPVETKIIDLAVRKTAGCFRALPKKKNRISGTGVE